MFLPLTHAKRQKKPCKRILIVDDDEGLTYVLREMLQAEGYQVMTARDGRYGYFGSQLFHPDLVITDIRMPERSGLEMMKCIRKHDPGVRTIYMSADLGTFLSELEDERREYGACVIGKPFSKNDLMRMIAEQAQSHEA